MGLKLKCGGTSGGKNGLSGLPPNIKKKKKYLDTLREYDTVTSLYIDYISKQYLVPRFDRWKIIQKNLSKVGKNITLFRRKDFASKSIRWVQENRLRCKLFCKNDKLMKYHVCNNRNIYQQRIFKSYYYIQFEVETLFDLLKTFIFFLSTPSSSSLAHFFLHFFFFLHEDFFSYYGSYRIFTTLRISIFAQDVSHWI